MSTINTRPSRAAAKMAARLQDIHGTKRQGTKPWIHAIDAAITLQSLQREPSKERVLLVERNLKALMASVSKAEDVASTWEALEQWFIVRGEFLALI